MTKHAEEAVAKRSLSLDWIDRAIAAPDFTEIDPQDSALTRSFKRSLKPAGEFCGLCTARKATTL